MYYKLNEPIKAIKQVIRCILAPKKQKNHDSPFSRLLNIVVAFLGHWLHLAGDGCSMEPQPQQILKHFT